MTIRKGQEWGHFENRPDDLQVVADDFAAGDLITSQALNPESAMNLTIEKSGLSRALGIKNALRRNYQMLCTKFDVIEVNYTPADSDAVARRCFIGNAFIYQQLVFGRTIAILNSSFVGDRDWAPKAHPNDGKFDVVDLDGSISIRQRLTALKLMKSGSHLPHPKIRYSQVPEFEFLSERSASLSIEGIRIGAVRHCVFKVLPDAVNLYW
ncbi:MAG: hypothetical protein ACKOPL_07765 [Acidimicrobiaceae bacterium]